jgi:hypothetical protein
MLCRYSAWTSLGQGFPAYLDHLLYKTNGYLVMPAKAMAVRTEVIQWQQTRLHLNRVKVGFLKQFL